MQRRDKTRPHQAREGEVAATGALFFFPLHGISALCIHFLPQSTVYEHKATFAGCSLEQNSQRAEVCPHQFVFKNLNQLVSNVHFHIILNSSLLHSNPQRQNTFIKSYSHSNSLVIFHGLLVSLFN